MEAAALHALNTPFDDDGNLIPLNLDQFSNVSGIQSAELQGHASAVLSGFQTEADSALKSLGVDTENFYQFLKDEHPAKLQDAMRQHYFTKDPSVWKSLVPLYRTSVMPSDEVLTKAGLKVTRMNGQSYITLRGMQMTVQQAAKSGLI